MLKNILLGAVCFQEYSNGYLDFVEFAASLGLEWVEFKYELPLSEHSNSKKYNEIRKRADLLGIGLSMHTAFDGLNIASIDSEERLSSIGKVKESIEAASEMEITYATLHAGHLMSNQYLVENWKKSVIYNIENVLKNYSNDIWTFPLSIEMKSEENVRKSLKFVREKINS